MIKIEEQSVGVNLSVSTSQGVFPLLTTAMTDTNSYKVLCKMGIAQITPTRAWGRRVLKTRLSTQSVKNHDDGAGNKGISSAYTTSTAS